MADHVLVGVEPMASSKRMTGDWRKGYARRLTITDALALVWVVFGVQILWLGIDTRAQTDELLGSHAGISYSLISLLIVVLWVAALGLYDTRSARTIGTGSAEYTRVVNASVRLFGLIAIVAFVLKIDLARGYVLIALPVGALVLLAIRWMWRQWLHVQRELGGYSSRVLLVGSAASVAQTAAELINQPDAGYRVVGACLSPSDRVAPLAEHAIPVVGTLDDVPGAMELSDADTVIITSSDELPNDRVRRISWGLQPGRQHLVVAPSIIDVGGPRIHTRPVAGLPLMHVETPRYEGAKLVAKRAFDLVVAGLLVVLLSPALIAIALAVRVDSQGPVLFKQERIGLNGRPFRMLKFRSMVPDAEARLAALRGESEGNGVLFKMKRDPRITRVGRVLRRYSLDELPQLFNVLGGSMSLIGPRPSLERELTQYEEHTHRRFLVKPGITGLWQVSGRSNLTWEESVRLDLYYVENWSMTGDLTILWRTAKAVIARDGAY
ncbi:sugar transferase [Gryllotalpicola kribbensis]|jgi:exopolysaccharide biosynthesis polyprenyl glycosylphosphotransferase|uniref:Sugar transferase n=1 Tax=Gryllotalpicola kribbensis TaxID=993084 RepID=A0ABP8AQ44_9MICO